MVCYESQEHQVLVGIAIFALIVYVFGIPAVTLGITLYARRKDLLKDKVYLRLFGLFFREYGLSSSKSLPEPVLERQALRPGVSLHCRTNGAPLRVVFVCAEPEYYWWDFVFLLRRFAISLCATALSGNPDAQAVLAALPSSPCERRFVAVRAT